LRSRENFCIIHATNHGDIWRSRLSANIRALAAATAADKLFTLVEGLRRKIETSLVFLIYLNPVYNYS
jgi:hypothetical protein